MRIFVAQLNPTIGDFEGNTQKILQSLDHARAQRADIVLFSELILCGYPPEDLLLHPSFLESQEKYLEKIVQASSGLMVFVGLVRRASGEKPICNSMAVIRDGKLLGYEDKRLLPTYDVFDERRYFEPGTTARVWEFKGKKIGVLICEDIWQHAGYVGYTHYARDPVLDLAALQPDLILNPSASPYHFQKLEMRVKICSQCATTLHCPVIMCCQVGGNDQLIFDGYSLYIDAQGELRQLAKGFAEDEMLIDLGAPTSSCAIPNDPLDDLYQALVLGVRDYFHKSGFKQACLGLSGGIDSALVACIATDALGPKNVPAVIMPSPFSNPESMRDAKTLATTLGIQEQEILIDKPFATFIDLLHPTFQGKAPDVTEENLQARIRGMLLMALSNKLGHIVLSTGNKSELAMGYCTLYGDMCGGLGVIADVTKEQVYALSRWINKTQEIIPPTILTRAPSAELRPNQKDSDTLPDYALVDQVLTAYLEEFLSPPQIATRYNIPLALVTDLVKKIHRAEYKRRQSPPGLRVSKKAFRVGRCYPIVQRWV